MKCFDKLITTFKPQFQKVNLIIKIILQQRSKRSLMLGKCMSVCLKFLLLAETRNNFNLRHIPFAILLMLSKHDESKRSGIFSDYINMSLTGRHCWLHLLCMTNAICCIRCSSMIPHVSNSSAIVVLQPWHFIS